MIIIIKPQNDTFFLLQPYHRQPMTPGVCMLIILKPGHCNTSPSKFVC